MDRTKVKAINEAACAALEQVAKEFGVQLVRKNGSFSDTDFTFKAVFAETVKMMQAKL